MGAIKPPDPPAAPGKKKRGTKKGRRRAALDHDEPFRMCIVCRASKVPTELLRFARSVDGGLGFDVAARLPGRGAWVCTSKACLEKSTDPKHGGFARAFDAAVVFDGPALRVQVRALLNAEVLARLGLLRRQGDLILGRDDAARRQLNLAFVGLSVDLSENSLHEVKESLPGVETLPLPSMDVIGAALGVRPVGVVGVLKGHGVAGLKTAIARCIDVAGVWSVPTV